MFQWVNGILAMAVWGKEEVNARAERCIRRADITNRWWMNQMQAVWKRSNQLQKEISSEGVAGCISGFRVLSNFGTSEKVVFDNLEGIF
jgi:hypothetical protein